MPVLAQHAATTVEHGTPHEVVALARHVFGPIGIECDPFSSPYWNSMVIKAEVFFDEEDDALDPGRPWTSGDPDFDTFFINPPGGLVKQAWRFAWERWLEGSAVFWLGFNLEQLAYLQGVGAMFRGFSRFIPPRRLAFLRRPGDVANELSARLLEAPTDEKARAIQRQLELLLRAHPDPNGPPIRGMSPTHSNVLLLMPSEQDQVERFEGAAKLLPAEVF